MTPNDFDEIPDTYCEDPDCGLCNRWDDYIDCEEDDNAEPCLDDDCPFCP